MTSPNALSVGDYAHFGRGKDAPIVRITAFVRKGDAELVEVTSPTGERWRSSFQNLRPVGEGKLAAVPSPPQRSLREAA